MYASSCQTKSAVFCLGVFLKRFNKTYVENQRSLKDLPHPDGSRFKGILVLDDGTLGDLGVRYRFFRRLSAWNSEVHQKLEDHIVQDSAEKIFDELTQPSKAEDSEVTVVGVWNVRDV